MSLALVESEVNPDDGTFPCPVGYHTDPCGKLNIGVRLLRPLNPYCHSEALLLCQTSGISWVAWVLDHGEATLRLGEFCINRQD